MTKKKKKKKKKLNEKILYHADERYRNALTTTILL